MNKEVVKCKHCGKEIHDTQQIISIMSGCLYAYERDGERQNSICDLTGRYLFHHDCFVEAAGNDFNPVGHWKEE